jgi:hypothetical protein
MLLLAALAGTHRGEALHVQLLLGDRRRPTSVKQDSVSPSHRRAVTGKESGYRFGCEIRIAATAGDLLVPGAWWSQLLPRSVPLRFRGYASA